MTYEDVVLACLVREKNGEDSFSSVASELRAAGFKVGNNSDFENALTQRGFSFRVEYVADTNNIRRRFVCL